MSYPDAVAEAVALFRSAGPADLATVVPATPRWTARDLLAHLVDGARRNLAGIMRPPADDEAHEAVLARRDAPVDELLADLARMAPDVTIPEGPGPSTAWDLVCHLADVREAWGRQRLAEALWRPMLDDTLEFGALTGRLGCEVVVGDRSWGDGQRLTIGGDGYRLYRALFGRLPLGELDADGPVELLRPAVFFA